MHLPVHTLIALGALLFAATTALAQTPPEPLKAAAQKAIASNPEVTARFNAFRAADNEVDVARGAYYPRVDANADLGRSRSRFDGANGQSISRTGVGLSITQLLWDGYATRSEVNRFDHAKTARYFEFVDATEQTALEAARAYYDVLRYRRLVALAEDNYVQHKLALDQITSRFKAGVGRGVDVEQATARIALAESNLSTEVANLHDVMARYQRVVGEQPPADAPLGAPLEAGLPATAVDALQTASTHNASIAAAIENLRAVRSQAKGTKSAFQPRLEARARTGTGRNFNGLQDERTDSAIELVATWNLYNGGSDQARVRQFVDLVRQAADQRDTSCRDVRQTASIAFNDTIKLTEQLRYLERNVVAIERTRDAYRQQFEIGQRSLLDLLNAQNEVYTSRRALANDEYDLRIAYARAHAALNTLTAALGLSRIDTGMPLDQGWEVDGDAATHCPPVASMPEATPLAELDERARALAASRPPSTLPTAPASAPQPVAPPRR